MKAILVIDMPNVCCSADKTCDICVDTDWGHICAKTGRDVLWEQKRDWCPLRPLPEKRVEEEHNDDGSITVDLLAGGWNKCLDAITGGKET